MKSYNIIGLMSGTSADGLDIVLCNFQKDNTKWQYKVLKSQTIDYTPSQRAKLLDLHKFSATDLRKADIDFGRFSAESVNDFCKDLPYSIDFIASHGHTVFHEPALHYTLQIGDGNCIAKQTGITTIYDFRSGDIALGGQGAPLVPIGDELLFGDYDACLNLGGFSNISFRNGNGTRIAFDICPVNIIMNEYARRLGKKYDNGGEIAASGKCIKELLNELNVLDFYKKSYPKSLGREWVENTMMPILAKYENYNIPDILNTLICHISYQIVEVIKSRKNVLITGGGAYNSFLIETIRESCSTEIIIPENSIINYKEAIIFAFLGVLRINNENNCLASITGADRDSCCGIIAEAR